MNTEEFKTRNLFFYNETVLVWEQLCKLHSQLFDLTCEEYSCLLSSELEKVEEVVKEKQTIIDLVSELNHARSQLMEDISSHFGKDIQKASQLILAFKDFENKHHNGTLQKLNLLLIDMIEKIQEQNKKNQIFVNKAIDSLAQMKVGFSGKKNFKTYNQSGKTTSASSP